ncbi:MAG TPA: class I SAM-dependent methyltransferase [Candidatus Bipolaricaulota bacterium]|nr:class I SAM-dependent methyltransferase [Candidatus Bipolaricaulota bacterium]
MKEELKKIIEHENETWSKIFDTELKNTSKEKFSSYWWEDYYQELLTYINGLLTKNNINNVLEAGSGSGKATILLNNRFSKTLLDISPVALKYATYLAEKNSCKNIKNIEGNIFDMPFKSDDFDFVWNIGVIEHYDLKEIDLIFQEMIRVCDRNGVVAVGVPNFYSGPIIKAWILKKIKIFPGYKLDTGKFYNIKAIKNTLKNASKKMGRDIDDIHIEYFGNPLIMETPKFILKSIGRLINRIFRKNKFLILIVCKFKKYD